MKRIATIIVLSLVMCLVMAFPASAAYTVIDDKGYINNMNIVKSTIASYYPSGYKYVLFYSGSPYQTSWAISFFVTNTSTINIGSRLYGGRINPDGTIVRTTNVSYVVSNIKGGEGDSSVSLTGTDFGFGVSAVFKSHSNLVISGRNTDFKLKNGYDFFVNLVALNTSALESLLSQAKSIQNDNYTSESWNALQSQIAAAESVLASSDKTQEQIDSATTSLQAAIDNLEYLPPLPDTSELEELLVIADSIEDIGYTATSWTRFDNARISGHELLARPVYTEPEVQVTTVELRTSMDALTIYVPPEPPSPPSEPLGYDLSTGSVSGYLNVVPGIFYNYVLSAQPIAIGLFGIIISILIIPRVLGVVLPRLKR